MIVRDEENIIEESLKSISKYNLEIIVVDTGSKDKTKEIALKYTSMVYDFNWCNDFSKARNFSISKASNEYVLIIDADEIIESININKIELYKDKVGRLIRINEFIRKNEKYKYSERVNRLFNKNEFIYKGRIHEQITRKNEEAYETYNLPIVINHSGYQNAEIIKKNKTERNIKLLKEELSVVGEDPYIFYQLGKSYYMDENYKRAEGYFKKAMEYDLDIKLEYVSDMIESYGYTLINQERFSEALDILNLYNEFKEYCDFVFLCGLIYMNNGFFKEAIGEFKKALSYSNCKMDGVNDYLSNYNIGVIYECTGDMSKALTYYEKSGEYIKAIDGIRRIKKK